MQIVIRAAEEALASSGSSVGAVGDASGAAVVVVHVAGEIDLYTGPELRKALSDLLESAANAGRPFPAGPEQAAHERAEAEMLRALVLDLSEVTFLDSYSLGVVVQAAKKARARKVGFVLAGVNGSIAKLFEMTGLHRVIALHPDVAAAVTAVAAVWQGVQLRGDASTSGDSCGA